MKAVFTTALTLILIAGPWTLADDALVVYSSRKEHLIKPLFDQFEREEKIKIRYITDAPGPLVARLKAEGANTPADLFLTVDAGNLWHAANENLLKATPSKTLDNNIPTHLRDAENRWFGLSIRARTIAYNKDKVKTDELKSYQDLAKPQWKDRLCLRTSKKVYNQSLVAMMVNHHGQNATENVVKGWVNNLSLPPFSNDTKALKAVASGRCDVTIVNTYYYGRLMADKPALPLKLFWPNQEQEGVHINISGAGVVNKEKVHPAALKFIEWMSAVPAQNLLATLNMEYPVNPKAKTDPKVLAWGSFKMDATPVAKSGEGQAEAVKLMDRAGYR